MNAQTRDGDASGWLFLTAVGVALVGIFVDAVAKRRRSSDEEVTSGNR